MLFAPIAFAGEDDNRFTVEFETGFVGQTYNDVQIPNDSLGTRFALDDVIGSGSFNAFRIAANWKLTGKQEL